MTFAVRLTHRERANRLFLNAIRYLAQTGVAWRDVPGCFGNVSGLWQRYNRWCRRGSGRPSPTSCGTTAPNG